MIMIPSEMQDIAVKKDVLAQAREGVEIMIEGEAQ